jgi:cytochrome c551/c552
MKTSIKISLLLILTVAFFVRARHSDHAKNVSVRQAGITFPADVKAVIDNKCYGCHSKDGRSAEAKQDLLWDSIPLYPKEKQIAVLDDISEVLEKGKMPPEKMIEMHPEAKLSPEQVALLKKWAETTADDLMK